MFNFLIKLLFIFLITFNTSTAHADINVDPTGVLLDIFDVQADALKETSDKTIKSLADNALANFENIYEIVDSEQNFGNIDFNDKQCLTKTVDLIYEHEALKATLGLTTALNDISKAAKLESDIKALFDLVGLVKNVKEASRELASLLKSNKKAYVVNNLLAFGGNRNIKNPR